MKKDFRKNRILCLVGKGFKSLKNVGLKNTLTIIQEKRILSKKIKDYKFSELTKKERKIQLSTKFKRNIKISIVVPLYNTPKDFLVKMIQSVQNQTYINWELCMADGSEDSHKEVKQICEKYANKDTRIQYKKLQKNLGISGNTNECIKMATGEYIGLFDHDDLLHSATLYEYMHKICDEDADFIYCDEDKIDETGKRFFYPFFKPDFSPDMLRSQNYICHFTVFKKSLLDKTGDFNSEYDGSQDHDLILRLTEQAKNIVHIPKVLYHWRLHNDSTAYSGDSKPYTVDAGIKAVKSHISRLGYNGDVEFDSYLRTYRVKFDIKEYKKISILIPNKDHQKDLELCINSIQKSTYQNYEIIIIENNSTSIEIFDYYKELQKYDNIKVVYWTGNFNYSAINNFGAEHATGDYYLLLNNDIEIITKNWLEEMLSLCQRDDVGIVGAKLYYPDDTIQPR